MYCCCFFPYLFKKTNLFNLVEFTVRNVIFFYKKNTFKIFKNYFLDNKKKDYPLRLSVKPQLSK